ncbi:DNA polymerase III subunit delta [Brevundimonas sp.]|uniref:DNA polymerase III subunit delta n=1 Tax=Brevundimonas sp. TaxID=1871086 RepID=UPI002635ED0B|nr:DNA polymerase III subunit delta [Brevundimonas sp.]
MILSKRPEIERFLKSPDPAVRAVVLHGRDRSGVAERADVLCRTITPDLNDPFNVSLMGDGDAEAGDGRLEDALSALSMIGGRRLVRVRLAADRAAADKALAVALKAHLDGRFNPDAMLVVEAGALGRDSALRKAAEAAPTAVAVACYEDEAGDVARMAREALAADKVGLTAEALDQFVGRLPRERGLMRQEIERLALFIGPGSGRTIDVAELETHLGVEADASLQDAAQQAFGGKAGPAQAGLRRAFAEGEGAVPALRAVGRQLQTLIRIQSLVAAGAGAKEAAKSAGVFWKQEAEVLRQLRAWSPEALDAVMDSLNAAELACRSTGSPDLLIAERLLLEIAARARRLGL